MILTHPCGIVFDIVSSDVYDFFSENKDFSNISTKMVIFFENFEKKNGNFLKFSYNYVHLAHAILYMAVADEKIYC